MTEIKELEQAQEVKTEAQEQTQEAQETVKEQAQEAQTQAQELTPEQVKEAQDFTIKEMLEQLLNSIRDGKTNAHNLLAKNEAIISVLRDRLNGQNYDEKDLSFFNDELKIKEQDSESLKETCAKLAEHEKTLLNVINEVNNDPKIEKIVFDLFLVLIRR